MKASEIINAAEAVAQWAERNKAVIEMGVVVGKLGSVVQACEESDRRLADVKAAIAYANSELAATKTAFALVRAEQHKDIERINAEANKTISDAAAAGVKTIGDAELEAQKIVAAARSEAAQVLATSRANVEAANKAVGLANADLSKIAAAAGAASVELGTLNAKIAQARAAIAKALS